ncbi:MAG: hypothetical protein ACRD8K_00700 [Nitrososphaeraceae archaeon]
MTEFLLMVGNVIYEQKVKLSRYKVLDTEDPTIIKTTNTDNDIIYGTKVTEIVTYHII